MKSYPNKTTSPLAPTAIVMAGIALSTLGVRGEAGRQIEGARESASEVVPDVYPLSRYEGLWKNSLFAPGKVVAEVSAAPSNLSLVGVFEVDGVGHAVLMDTTNGMTEEINTAHVSQGGSRLAKIESSPDIMKTRVQVEHGGSLIWVGYNIGATSKSSAMQAKSERLRLLQEKQKAMAAAAQPGGGSIGNVPGTGGASGKQPGGKSERPRTVVLPSTIPMTSRPK